MHACVEALSAQWQIRLGRPLALHIGINSGRVVAGHLGSSANAAYAVTGDAVNTAARLQAAAEAKQTLVSGATFVLTQREFAFDASGTVALKGKAEPLQVYRLLGSLTSQAPCAASRCMGSRHPSSDATPNSRRCSLPLGARFVMPRTSREPGRGGRSRQDAAGRRDARAAQVRRRIRSRRRYAA